MLCEPRSLLTTYNYLCLFSLGPFLSCMCGRVSSFSFLKFLFSIKLFSLCSVDFHEANGAWTHGATVSQRGKPEHSQQVNALIELAIGSAL